MTVSDLNSPFAQRVAASLARQGMMTHLDAQLLRVEKGEVEVALPFGDKVTLEAAHGCSGCTDNDNGVMRSGHFNYS